MTFEESIDISAEPKAVFAVYQNVADWPRWDPETEAASLDGEFVKGATGTVKPKGAPITKIKIIELTQDQSFTIECTLPLCKMRFIHVMKGTDSGTHLVNQLVFTGLLSPVFGRMFGKGISKSLPGSLAGIKRFIEQ